VDQWIVPRPLRSPAGGAGEVAGAGAVREVPDAVLPRAPVSADPPRVLVAVV
jgi:hypothetical protein